MPLRQSKQTVVYMLLLSVCGFVDVCWAGRPRLYIEPIPGLTTARHLAPSEVAVPVGTLLRLRLAGVDSASVLWTGAQEVEREANASVAECFLDRLGPALVTATLSEAGRVRERFTCKINAVEVAAERIRVERARAVTDQIDLDEFATNGQTMALYFKSDSIAAVTPVARRAGLGRLGRGAKGRGFVPRYVTSVKRPIELGVDVTPSVFGSIMEWRIDGRAVSLGDSATHKFFEPGEHVISVGPPEAAHEIEIQTYRVTITSHTSGDNIVPESEAITFEAVTDPPGFEDYITWLSSTKYGTAAPVLGYGPTFTVQFDDTFGDDPQRGYFQWLGVRADNALFGQDQKTGGCCLPGDSWCYEGVTGSECLLLEGVYGGDGSLCDAETCGVPAPKKCRYTPDITFAGGCNAAACPIKAVWNAMDPNKACDVPNPDCPARNTDPNSPYACPGGGTCTIDGDKKACQ